MGSGHGNHCHCENVRGFLFFFCFCCLLFIIIIIFFSNIHLTFSFLFSTNTTGCLLLFSNVSLRMCGGGEVETIHQKRGSLFWATLQLFPPRQSLGFSA